MPWQTRLDTPRTLHHVMGRGIEGEKYSGKMGIGRIFRFWVLFVEFSFSFIIRLRNSFWVGPSQLFDFQVYMMSQKKILLCFKSSFGGAKPKDKAYQPL
jgi:hypothetical protein